MIEVNILLSAEVLSFARLGKEEIRGEMRRLLLLYNWYEKVKYLMARQQSFLILDKLSSYSIWHNIKSPPSNLHRRNSLGVGANPIEDYLQQWALDQSGQSGPVHPKEQG